MKKFKSEIGLPKKMTPDEAYIQGVADGIDEAIKKLREAGWDNLPYHWFKGNPVQWLEAELT
jgi:hypothetical protein